ncbi:hypothetical protein ACP3V3_01880 [Vibrio sp. PNB22_3_1]
MKTEIFNMCYGDLSDGALSDREIDLLYHTDFIAVGKRETIRFVRGFADDNCVKYMELSDEDFCVDCSPESQATVKSNYDESKAAFQKMSQGFGVELVEELTYDDKENLADYTLSLLVPLETFSKLANKEQLLKFFKICTFEHDNSINQALIEAAQ